MNSDGDTRVERGSGNVFADLGRPDAEAHLLKAELVFRIDEIIRQRRMTQAHAAELLGISQPDVSRLLRGNVRDYSVERLLRLLTALVLQPGFMVGSPSPMAAAGALLVSAPPV